LYNYIKLKKRPILGFQSPGIQIYCPLNQNIVLLLIDKKFYHITLDEIRDIGGIIYITKQSDIDTINKLQILSCDENIIFSSQKYEQYIMEIHTQLYRKYTRNMRWKADTSLKGKALASETSYDYQLNLSFLSLNQDLNKKLKGAVKKVEDAGGIPKLCRNPDMCKIIEKEYMKKVKSTKL
jgi:hypothetical protein